MTSDSFFAQFSISTVFTLGMLSYLLIIYIAFRINRIYVDMLSNRPSILKWYNRSRVVFLIWSMFTFCYFYSTLGLASQHLDNFTIDCWISYIALSMPFTIFHKLEQEGFSCVLTKKRRAIVHLIFIAMWLVWLNDTHNLRTLFS